MTLARVLALDYGKARIGVALSDPLGYTAQPLLTIHRKSPNEDLRNLLRLTRRYECTRILVGNPLHLSGDASPWTHQVHQFVETLRARTILPIELVDERLTSRAADELLREAGKSPDERKRLIDQVAATLILETWMHEQNSRRSLQDVPA